MVSLSWCRRRFYLMGRLRPVRLALNFISTVLKKESQNTILNNSDYYPINANSLHESKREDIGKGYRKAVKSKSVLPSFERNVHPSLHYPIKWSLIMLFSLEDGSLNDILSLLYFIIFDTKNTKTDGCSD